jgi:hypothetical protein
MSEMPREVVVAWKLCGLCKVIQTLQQQQRYNISLASIQTSRTTNGSGSFGQSRLSRQLTSPNHKLPRRFHLSEHLCALDHCSQPTPELSRWVQNSNGPHPRCARRSSSTLRTQVTNSYPRRRSCLFRIRPRRSPMLE